MAFLLLVCLGFCEMWVNAGAIKLAKPVIMGPSEALMNDVANFECGLVENPQNLSVFYQLFIGQNMDKVLGDYSALSGQNASFTFVLNSNYDGRLICKASGHNNSDIEPSYSDWLDLRVIDTVYGAFIRSTPDPGDLWEGETLTLQCNITKGNYETYSWDFNNRPINFHHQLTIQSLSTQHSGKYVCTASNQLNDTLVFSSRSNVIDVHVKVDVSKPAISFDVLINIEKNLTANVTCHVEKGTPPINFTLLKGSQIITGILGESQTSSFLIPVLLDQDMDLVQCQASNGKSLVKSEKLNLTVESVGGAVTMRVEKAEGPLFQVLGVWLHCSVERGTFPHFSWFLNDSNLEGKGPFYTVFGVHQSGLSLSLGLSSAGIYHCEAGNNFDNSTRLRSQKTLITKEGMNRVPPVGVALVFICFSVLIIAVTACCLYGVLRRKQAGRYKFKQYFSEMSNIMDDDEEENSTFENEEDIYENGEDIYENGEDIYENGEDIYDVVVGEYREETDMESSTAEESDEGEEEDENSEHKDNE